MDKLGIMVPIGRIIPSKTNPRTNITPESIKELVENIKVKGIIYPITCRSVEDAGQHCEIIDGERRWRAAKILGLEEIPVDIRLMNDAEAQEAQLISFVQREDITPLEESEAYLQLQKKTKYDIKTIAEKFGKTSIYVAKRMQLIKLIKAGKELLEKGKISIGAALEVARLPEDLQKEAVKWADDELDYNTPFISEKDISEYIKENIYMDLNKASFKKDDSLLVPKAGPCTKCPKRTGAYADLFEDLGKNDKCLDGKCFSSKIKAHIEKIIEEKEAEGKQLVRVSTDYHGDQEMNAIGTGNYDEVPKKESNATGILVDGNRKGQIVYIKTEKTQEKDSSGAIVNKFSYAERVKRWEKRLENHNNRIDQEVRRRLVKSLLPKMTKITKEDLLLIIRWIEAEMFGDEDLIQEALNLGTVSPFEGKYLKSLTDGQLFRIILGFVVTKDEMINNLDYIKDSEKLDELVKRYKVDYSGILKQVTDEMRAKEPKKPVKEEKSKSAKSKKSIKVKKSDRSKK